MPPISLGFSPVAVLPGPGFIGRDRRVSNPCFGPPFRDERDINGEKGGLYCTTHFGIMSLQIRVI